MSERSDRLVLPVLPLREVVLFPGITAPIGAGRPGTHRAIEAALATPERLIFAVSQRQNTESVEAEGLYTIGTVARLGQMQRGLAGMQLLLHGEYRGIAMVDGDRQSRRANTTTTGVTTRAQTPLAPVAITTKPRRRLVMAPTRTTAPAARTKRK